MTGAERLKKALRDADATVLSEGAGVHGLTRGWPLGDHLLRTPLSEAASVGVANGLAMGGRRVVVELFDGEGVARAAEALAEAADLGRRSQGTLRAPVVLLAPLGAHVVQTAARHAVASSAADLPGMLTDALAADEPTVLWLSAAALTGSEAEDPLPLGRARRVRAGAGITILAEGDGVPVALEGDQGAEVLDLRGGLDAEAVGASVRRTGRILLVHHGVTAALALAVREAFWYLEAPPRGVHAREGAAGVAAAVASILAE
jgi:pyruvate/2-oxoglutarate/acetoin dehydrogenase E1 component